MLCRKRFLAASLIMVAIALMSCKGSQGNYVKVAFRYLSGSGSNWAVKEQPVALLMGNAISQSSITACVNSFSINGYNLAGFFEASSSFSEEKDYISPNSMPSDDKMARRISVDGLANELFSEDTCLYALYVTEN